jgi:hypothetical protein
MTTANTDAATTFTFRGTYYLSTGLVYIIYTRVNVVLTTAMFVLVD